MLTESFDTKLLSVTEFYDEQNKDWILSNDHAHFVHQEDCQFIFYVGCEDSLNDYVVAGFSEKFQKIMRDAHERGYDYVRLTD